MRQTSVRINNATFQKTVLLKNKQFYFFMTRDSSVGIATGYGLDGRGVGVRVPVGSRIFSSQHSPDHFGTHPASYPMGTRSSLPGGKAPLQLVPRSRKSGSMHPPPIHLHGVVLNLLIPGTTLPFLHKNNKSDNCAWH
jgi:hypothetical protein